MKGCGRQVKNMGREGTDGRTRLCSRVNFGEISERDRDY